MTKRRSLANGMVQVLAVTGFLLAGTSNSLAYQKVQWNGAGWYQVVILSEGFSIDYEGLAGGPYGDEATCNADKKPLTGTLSEDEYIDCKYLTKDPDREPMK